MRSSKPILIGIAGVTCSGKSNLAGRLKEQLSEKDPQVISCDSYYRDLSHMPPSERTKRNFDDPESIESELLKIHLDGLVAGNRILRPVYDFHTHTRESHAISVAPGDLIIVEGLFVLYWPEIRDLLDLKVFVSLSEGDSLLRRLERDVKERGRTQESVVHQYGSTVRPMMSKYVLPSSMFADVLVNGADPAEQSAAIIMNRVNALRRF